MAPCGVLLMSSKSFPLTLITLQELSRTVKAMFYPTSSMGLVMDLHI